MTAAPRAEVIAAVGDVLCSTVLGHPVRVAVDGITASGKSTWAGELAAAIAAAGRPAIHLTMDGYHNPRECRHRQGRLSAEGYYDDAYNFLALVSHVLRPLGPRGNRCYRSKSLILGLTERWTIRPSKLRRTPY